MLKNFDELDLCLLGNIWGIMVNVLKFQKLFSFCSQNKMLVFRAGFHKMLIRQANRKDPDQTANRVDPDQTANRVDPDQTAP